MNQTNNQVLNCETSMQQWKEWATHQQIDDSLNPEEKQLQEPKQKKWKSAFQLFKLDNIVELKKQHPEYGYKDRLDTLKLMWKALPQEKKFLYVQKSKLN